MIPRPAPRRAIERPVIRRVVWDGTNVPGWKVSVNYEDGHGETTWQRWEDALRWGNQVAGEPPGMERVHVPTMSELVRVAPRRSVSVVDTERLEAWRRWMPWREQ